MSARQEGQTGRDIMVSIKSQFICSFVTCPLCVTKLLKTIFNKKKNDRWLSGRASDL